MASSHSNPSTSRNSRASISHLINHSPPSPNDFNIDSSAFFSENNSSNDSETSNVRSQPQSPIGSNNRTMLMKERLEQLTIDEDMKIAANALGALKSGTGGKGKGEVTSVGGSRGSENGYHPRYEEVSSKYPHQLNHSHIHTNDTYPSQNNSYRYSAPSTSSTAASTFSLLNPETSSQGPYDYEEPGSPLTSAMDRSSFDVSRSSFDGSFEDCEEEFKTEMEDIRREEVASDGDFITRVSRTPLVSGAISLYEQSKNSNRVVRYGAEIVESSVKTIYGPVFDRVGGVVGTANLMQLEEFAHRQLDRFEGKSVNNRNSPRIESTVSEDDTEMDSDGDGEKRGRRGKRPVSSSRAAAPTNDKQLTKVSTQQEVAPSTSGWHNLMMEASMTAGGIGAAVNEESMKSLKYCLQWLQWASANLEHEITVLQGFIASLNQPVPSNAIMSPQAIETFTKIKLDVVETIRKAVDVISKYAGSALPENAQRFVRESILNLPIRWAQAVQRDPGHAATGGGVDGELPTKTVTQEAAGRILTFAIEGLDMLKTVTIIFGESVERAEAWIDRFRFLNAQRLRQRQNRSPSRDQIMETENEPTSNRGQSSALPRNDFPLHRVSRNGMEIDAI